MKQHPDPTKEKLTARYLKDNLSYRKSVIKKFDEENEKHLPQMNGLRLKGAKQLWEANPILWDNGYLAKGVDGQTMYNQSYRRLKRQLPTLTKEKYKAKRKEYLLDE